MSKAFLCLALLCLGTIIIASEVHEQYVIRPSVSSQSPICGDRSYCNEEYNYHHLTLSQFVSNLSDYLTNDSRLIFSPGNYSLESDLIVENVHSFSIFAWPSFSSTAVIVCGHNARFEFRNVSIVTVSGLEFVGCLENHVVSVGQFQLENSSFFGNGQAIVNNTVLTVNESAANLDRVAFISVVELQENCTATNSLMKRMIGISLKRSIIRITQSWFEGNNVVLGGLIYDEFGSDITIVNTTFVNNSASDPFYHGCNITVGISSGIVYTKSHGSAVKLYDSKFVENMGLIIFGDNCNMLITHSKFISNKYDAAIVYATSTNLVISHSTFVNNTGQVLDPRYTKMSITHNEFLGKNLYQFTKYTMSLNVLYGMIISVDPNKLINNTGLVFQPNVSISHSEFVGNNGIITVFIRGGMITSIDHCRFINNTGSLYAQNMNVVSITNSEFVDNSATGLGWLISLDGVITVSLSKFINNRAFDVVYIPYYTTAENLTNNVFMDNRAAYEIFIASGCRPGLSLSLGSPRCIECSNNWLEILIGIVIAAFIAGIALVIFMLALNMTVAVGTLNGIFFYAHIVAENADTYFWPFTTPDFVTMLISWLNLDIGFDACYYVTNDSTRSKPFLRQVYKALIQLAFPAYVIFLVVIVIVASDCSSKFAKIIGKGNPVAVLATMILLSYAKFLNAILASFSLLYLRPAYGSRKVDVSRFGYVLKSIKYTDIKSQAFSYFLLSVSILILLLAIIYTALIFSWQWLLRYQDKVIFKWVRYQKLRHFLEPYHAPYTAKYRYWTGLLLFVRAFLYLISLLNFSLDPRVELMATVFIVGGLILLKGVTAKRVYKNWLLDVMETAIYFNLVAFSALTWYNLDFGGNQVAVAYTSVMIIFILLLGVIVFHVLRYTKLYEFSSVEKAFKWITSKLLEKKPTQEPTNDVPEELDGYQLERTAAGDQEPPIITYSVVEIRQPTQNQEDEM